MKVYVLFTGDYEQRSIHSVHSSLEEALAVDKLVRPAWARQADSADIDEEDLDPDDLCSICGYRHSGLDHRHDFVRRSPPTRGGDK